MVIIIVTHFHHDGKFVKGTFGAGSTYMEQIEVEFVGINKDHFSLVELLFYTRDLGYDLSLLNLIKDLGDGDFLDLYVQHVVDEVKIVKDGVPTGYLCGLTVGESVNEGGVENSHDINVGEVESLHDISVDDVSDLEGVETDLDISDNSQKFVIPEDDSEINEKLRTLRNERKTKLPRKKPHSTKEITFGSAAGVDKGFEDIGRKNATRGCVLDTFGPIGIRSGEEKKEETILEMCKIKFLVEISR
ncbi:hypothetical protein H5410_001245 [Solanum commersonii]|uniref:Uncharacterized protein n=1 Tax=Solanum commersonii TaxID=4109 RepID=A0A9J6AYG8_SOLCO|nr:hypothetical protein H5410_001245 [Solanum commersonii]